MSRSYGNSINALVFLLISSSSLIVYASSSSSVNTSFKRADPLNHFKLYNGTYDITNKHYWASAAFTGIHGYALAGIWLLLGIGFGGYTIFKNGSSKTLSQQNSSVYIVTFSLIVLFTLFSIICCCFVVSEDQNCFHKVKRLKDTIFVALGETSQTMRRVINSLVVMQSLICPYDNSTCQLLNTTSHRIRRESIHIQSFVQQTKQPVDEATKVLYITNLAVTSFNLAMLVAALVFTMVHWYPGILISILCLWIITTLSWMLTGFDYFFHIFAEDTCWALKNFEQNPDNSSLPFVHVCSTSQDSNNNILTQIGYTIHNFISKINMKLMVLRQVLSSIDMKSFPVGEICDPFSVAPKYAYAPEICPKDSISIGDLAQLLSRLGCHNENSSANCISVESFLPEGSYKMAEAYSESIEHMVNVFPDVLSLIECSSVKQAISDIVMKQCKPLEKTTRGLWLSILALSIVLVVLVLLFIGKAFQDKGTYFSMFSIYPKPLPLPLPA